MSPSTRSGPVRPDAVTVALCVAAIAIPVATAIVHRSKESPTIPAVQRPATATPPPSQLDWRPAALPGTHDWRPRVTNVNPVDLDHDQQMDLLVCDAVHQAVWWHRQTGPGQFERRRLTPADGLAAPCHTELTDLDQDGDTDIVVAVLRSVWPTDRRVGQVVWLENDGQENFTTHVLLDDVRRVADVQPADLDADGDPDLVVAEFGYLHGAVLWLENLGQGRFVDHRLLTRAGATHVPVADYDNDGDLDVAAVVSQDNEEVWVFENRGGGVLTPHRVWATANFDLGCAGMMRADLDQDGDADLVLSAGDNMEFVYPCAQPWHGCYWLENLGGLQFREHCAARLPGCYASAVSDLDGDGAPDIVCGSMFSDQRAGAPVSLVWLRNEGGGQFSPRAIAETPTRICSVGCGDFDGDARPDIVAASLQIFEPFDDSAGVTVWYSGASAP